MAEPILEYAAPQSSRTKLLTIFLIVFIDLMGFGIVLPNLQLYGHAFGISNYFVLTLLGVAYSLFQFLFAPLLGKWSDRIGRRPVLLLSQTGTLLGFLLLYFAHFFESPATAPLGIALLFASRIIDGISGANISAASAYIADITPPDQRAKGMGLIGAAFGLGFIFGPLIGGLVGYFAGLPYVPLVACAFSATALTLTYLKLPESLNPNTNPKDLRRFSFYSMFHALARPIIGPLILMAFINGFAFAGMEQTFSLLIQNRLYPVSPALSTAAAQPATAPETISYDQLSLSNPHVFSDLHRAFARSQDARAARAAGFLFFLIGIIIALIQGRLIHPLTRRFGEPALVIVGPALIALGLFTLALPLTFWPNPWTGFVLGSILLAVGSSLFNPSVQSLLSRHAAPHEQGEILGAHQGLAALARVFGPLIAGILFQYLSPASPYYLAAAITLAVSLAAFGFVKNFRPPQTVPSPTP